ncbi:MAG: metal ABC transporter permease, partial [Burkholderiales bacterium]
MKTSDSIDKPANRGRREWRVVPLLAPYLLDYKWRVGIALAFLITAKLANVAVPLVLKSVVDSLSPTQAIVALPLALLV